MNGKGPVRELRVALTVEDFQEAVALYGDALDLRVVKEWDEPHGRSAIFAAGTATIEILDRPQAEHIDEVEVGERVSGSVRLALGVADVEQVAGSLRRHGAEAVGDPVTTPWGTSIGACGRPTACSSRSSGRTVDERRGSALRPNRHASVISIKRHRKVMS